MPTEANLQTTGTLAADIVSEWLYDELLPRAMRDTVFYDLCDKVRIPERNGSVVQFTRYEYLPLPYRPLEEGVTPVLTPLTISTVAAVLDQWGAVVGITDRAEMTVKHPTMQLARDLLRDQHDQLVDREVQVVLMGSSGIYYAGGAASRAALTAANVLRSDDIRKVVATLRANGARPWTRSLFKGVVDPYVEGDISKDPTFVTAGSFSQVETLNEFMIGTWMGVMWGRSNLIPIISQMAASDVTVAAVTGGSIPAGGTGFTASGSVITKVTRLDPNLRFETVIDDSVTTTNGAAFGVAVTIASGAPTGIYRLYATLLNGAAGTETLQVTRSHTTGTADTITFVMAGVVTDPAFVVTGTGPVAPPNAPATINVHTSYVLGKGHVACTNLGDGLETFYVPRRASESDPLAQRAKASWKRMFKTVITNPNFGTRIESASDFS